VLLCTIYGRREIISDMVIVLQTEEKLFQKINWEVRMRILSRGQFLRSKKMRLYVRVGVYRKDCLEADAVSLLWIVGAEDCL
jgi:hypothetical protein